MAGIGESPAPKAPLPLSRSPRFADSQPSAPNPSRSLPDTRPVSGPPSSSGAAPGSRIRARAITTGRVLRSRPVGDLIEILLHQDGHVRVTGSDVINVLVHPTGELAERIRSLRPGQRVDALLSVQICSLGPDESVTFCWLERLLASAGQ